MRLKIYVCQNSEGILVIKNILFFFFLFLLGDKRQGMHAVPDRQDTGKCKCLE